MKRNKNARPKPQNAFERETERRRREMLRNIAGAKAHIPKSMLRYMPRSARALLLEKRGDELKRVRP